MFSSSLICESIAVQFLGQFLTFVPHGEQTLVEKDSPSSRPTKSSFFSRSAHFGNVSPFLVRATNTFSELIHPLVKLPHILQFIRSARLFRHFSLFEEQAQALLSYYHFHSFLILHSIYYISLYTTFHGEPTLKTALELLYWITASRADINTRYSPSKSITECVKFTKGAELRTDF